MAFSLSSVLAYYFPGLRASKGGLTGLRDPAKWLMTWAGGQNTASGILVTPDRALQAGAVFACVKVLAETIASLPLIVYRRRDDRGKDRDRDHPLWSILHDFPNEWQTSFEFWEMMVGHFALRGNAYAQIVGSRGSSVDALIPLHPDRVRPIRLESGAIAYEYDPPTGPKQRFSRENVLHLRDMTKDGLIGMSRIQQVREAVGLTMGMEEHGARSFGNSVRPSGVLTHPGRLGKEAKKELSESWQAAYGGIGNVGKTAVLEEGLDWKQISMTSQDAQWLQGRKFQVEEIARIFRVPLQKIQSLDHATNNNVEHQAIEFVIDTVRPLAVRIEKAIFRDLFTPPDRRTHFAEFLIDGLLRGDRESRTASYIAGRQWGWFSANDVLELENRNPIGAQGDIYMVPLNMVPADQAMDPDETNGDRAVRALPIDTTKHLRRSLVGRQRLIEAYRRLFLEAAQRLVTRETKAVRAAVKKFLGSRSIDGFEAWIEKYYRDFPEAVKRVMLALLLSLAEAMSLEAGQEVGVDGELTPELERFIQAYVATLGIRHSSSSKGQLKKLIRETDTENLADAIAQRLSEWEERRPDKIATRESNQAGNAIAKLVWAAAGTRFLTWVTVGDNCPLCESLDGRTIQISSDFVAAGDSVDPGGGVSPLTASSPIGHPPLHPGCDCMIIPG